MTNPTVYRNTTVFTGSASDPLAEAFAVAEGRILAVGDLEAVRTVAGGGATEIDLGGKFSMPGINEGHAHLSMLGEAIGKVQLRDCTSLEEIQQRLLEARAADPDATQLLGVSWMFEALGAPRPTREMIDAVVSDIPVFLDANDLHSVWVNTAALEVMGIDRDSPNPVGGEVVRDEHGDATGFLIETAGTHYAWNYLASTRSDEDLDRFMESAFRVYLETGVTSATDMALEGSHLDALARKLERDGRLPFPITAHWLLDASGSTETDLAQVAYIAQRRDEIHERFGDRWLHIAGVKLILDGVIDACTAAMRAPYANGTMPGPIWTREAALPVALAADAAGLRLAMHAIGDAASEIAADLAEECGRVNGADAARRPRIEHLESVGLDTIERMAQLGITASMQPVHCDPAVIVNWVAMLGDERAEAGFPWHLFREAGVTLALGTDAPTAPHEAPHNLFIATTTKSALDPALAPYHPERAFTPGDALEAMTLGPAYAGGYDDELGRIAPGYRANITILAVNPLTDPAEALLTSGPGTGVQLVLVDGEVAYRA